MAIPLDQLLKDDEFPETERLLRSTGLKHLHQVADRKGNFLFEKLVTITVNLNFYLFVKNLVIFN